MFGFLSTKGNNQSVVQEQHNNKRLKTDIENDNDNSSYYDLSYVEGQISQLVSSGILNTSFLGDKDKCVVIWEYIQRQYDESQSEFDDLDIDSRLVSVIRAYGEGSTLPLSGLVPLLNDAINFHCAPLTIDLKQLFKFVPLLLIRKNLGEQYSSDSGVRYYDCIRSQCLWVWESPTQDVFPTNLIEFIRSAREHRNLLSRRFKSLVKLKDALNNNDKDTQDYTIQTIHTVDKRLSTVSIDKKSKLDKKNRNEKKVGSNMLLNWLKVPKDHVQANKCVVLLNGVEGSLDETFVDLCIKDEQKLMMISILNELNRMDENVSFIMRCESHRNVWNRIFTLMSVHRHFYVEDLTDPQKNIYVEDVHNNIEQDKYGDNLLKLIRPRIFQMYDNIWKRPPMRLLICRCSNNIGAKNQLGVELSLDYFNDSDEEWYERYDADDVEMISSDEEHDDDEGADEDDEWIVHDSPNHIREFSTGIFNNDNISDNIKVYCLYKNWHWIIDGNSLSSYDICNRQIASDHGIIVSPSVYGFGFEGYTKNPILEIFKCISSNKLTLGRNGIEDLIKFCHGKHQSRDELIYEFKNIKPYISVAEIKHKFNKYLFKTKIDDTPYRWLATPNATKIFNLKQQLDKILKIHLNESY